MGNQHLLFEAAVCRKQAAYYLGRPEAAFLLRAAGEFDRLATEPMDGRPELTRHDGANPRMYSSADHLRAKAAQCRLLARRAVDQQRADMMDGLARLYDEQANELDQRGV
jgi:hypothetical protein